ncbi:uncharacterized protein LOC136081273 [Hydra vulgaris]|uniref:Uncharacterized protein LOC136081273 n=1 Tax=Hydra vulgaris TaxID=6087 RepID=A0ABM4BZF4_HYDVU
MGPLQLSGSFRTDINQSNRNNVWCNGIRDWKHLSERIKQHSCSRGHPETCAVYEFWKETDTKTINKELENEIRKEASFWKMVLQRLFDIILTLAKSSLALRGYQEDLSQEGYYGNFLSFVELVARYDHFLRQVLDMPKGSTRYLSATIHNKMVESLGIELEIHLLEQIRATPFFAIILDTTQDKSKVDQLSIVVRYAVKNRSENGQPIDIEIKEVFLGFYAAIKHGAKTTLKAKFGLAKVAKRFLRPPPTSAEVKRLFLTAREIQMKETDFCQTT